MQKLAVITEDEVEAWLAQTIQLPSKGKSKRCTRAFDHYRKKEAARQVTAKARENSYGNNTKKSLLGVLQSITGLCRKILSVQAARVS